MNRNTVTQNTNCDSRDFTTYRLYGLTLASDFRLTKRVALLSNDTPDMTFTHHLVDSLPGQQMEMAPTYISPSQTPDGQSILFAYRLADYDLLHFPNTADFHVWPDRIVCYQLKSSNHYDIERWLTGHVLALYLERKGVPVIHATAVIVEGAAVGFMANSIAGKSSLVATMLQQGYPLLTDDALAVEWHDNTLIGHPGYPQMRLWPDQAEHFLGHYEDLELVHPEASKRAVPVGPEGIGTFCDEPRPLKCLYLPGRQDAGEGTEVEITPLSSGQAFMELVRHSFSVRLLAGLGMQPQRLPRLSQIAKHVPVRRITYPTGLEYLPGVCETILEDIQALPHLLNEPNVPGEHKH